MLQVFQIVNSVFMHYHVLLQNITNIFQKKKKKGYREKCKKRGGGEKTAGLKIYEEIENLHISVGFFSLLY